MLVRTIPWTAESAFAELQQRQSELQAIGTEANEAETRLKILDVLLFDVLDWEKSDVLPEFHCRAVGFADYILSVDSTVALVVEAKRTGESFTVPDAVFEADPVTFALLEKESRSAGLALRQALGYAAGLGARYICITNGFQ
jgi:predicted type IV restriction endonuclease